MSRTNPRFRRVNPSLPAVGTTNGVVLYRIWGAIENQLTINTFYYGAAVPSPSPTQLATLLTNISTNIFAKYAACISADWSAMKETLDVVHRNDLNGASSTANAGTFGGRLAGHEPTEVAGVILRRCAVKGQHGRGRMSLPAISLNDVTSSRLANVVLFGLLALLVTAMQNVASDGVNNWTPVMAQRALVSPRLVIGSSPLSSVLFSTLLGTIRRRKIGRGK